MSQFCGYFDLKLFQTWGHLTLTCSVGVFAQTYLCLCSVQSLNIQVSDVVPTHAPPQDTSRTVVFTFLFVHGLNKQDTRDQLVS